MPSFTSLIMPVLAGVVLLAAALPQIVAAQAQEDGSRFGRSGGRQGQYQGAQQGAQQQGAQQGGQQGDRRGAERGRSAPESAPRPPPDAAGFQRMGQMSPDERRALRREIHDVGRDVYRTPPNR